MKINLHELERCTLGEFADKHGLTMEIRERHPPTYGANYRYYACFDDCEVEEGGTLVGMYGTGKTPDEAMADYGIAISRKRLVFHAMSPERWEVTAPILHHLARSEK